MFTGLIQAVGNLTVFQKDAGGATLTISNAQKVLENAALGDSIAVNGVCLTVTEFTGDRFSAYASSETLEASSMGEWQAGRMVNLEASLTPETKMGGHFVQGHVDGIGRVKSIQQVGDSWEIEMEFPKALGPYFVPKGSVSLDGISLTVNSVNHKKASFRVRIIPTTWQETNIHTWKKESQVNIETDIMGRYIVHYLENYLGQQKGGEPLQGMTLQKLKEMGF